MPTARRPIRTPSGSCCRCVTQPIDVSPWMNRPTRTAFAIVPTPGVPPSDQPMQRMTTPTAIFATPNDNGECRAIPWFSTSHGERPSFDSRSRTIAIAKRNSPSTRLSARAGTPPRTTGCVRFTRAALEAERVERLGARGDEDALRLEVEVERLDRQLAAEARLLVAAERDAGERGERHVDADHPRLDLRGHAMTARGFAGPPRREQAVLDVVRDADRI